MPAVFSPALLSVCDAPASASKGTCAGVTPVCCDAVPGVAPAAAAAAAGAAAAASAVVREPSAGPDPVTADAAALLTSAGPDALLD